MPNEETQKKVETIAAIDIGYSAVKIAYGQKGGQPEVKTLVAGAGPASIVSEGIGSQVGADCCLVTMDEESWVVGVEPSRLQGWQRALFADYPSTRQYQALLKGALLVTGDDTIDHLVTGLPVAQALDPQKVAELKKLMLGEHQVTPKRTVTVKDVQVLPQPIGAWLDYLVQNETDAQWLEHALCIVIDIGFFSVDWVGIDNSELLKKMAGTSTNAMSALIDAANTLIATEYGGSVGRDKIERALREEQKEISVYGKSVLLQPFIEAAAKTTVEQALLHMQQNLRIDEHTFDAVLLTGGGASIYSKMVEKMYPKAKILKSTQPVLANARGFWSYV